MNEDDIEWALEKTLELLEPLYEGYEDDPLIQTILDIYYANFN